MKKKELTKEEKEVLDEIKTTWKTKFPKCKIYSEKRKTFYRMKLYNVPLTVAKKAKKIAEQFSIFANIEKPSSGFCTYLGNSYNCIIKYYYV